MKKRANLDAITLAVLRSGLINAVAEMKAVHHAHRLFEISGRRPEICLAAF